MTLSILDKGELTVVLESERLLDAVVKVPPSSILQLHCTIMPSHIFFSHLAQGLGELVDKCKAKYGTNTDKTSTDKEDNSEAPSSV